MLPQMKAGLLVGNAPLQMIFLDWTTLLLIGLVIVFAIIAVLIIIWVARRKTRPVPLLVAPVPVVPPPPPVAPAPPASVVAPGACPYCGKPIPPARIFCPYCNRKIL